MSRSLTRWQAILLGSVVLVAVVLGTLGLFAVAGRHWLGSDAFTVLAGFQDVGGVEVGSRVRIQGMDAGEVQAIVPPAAPGEPVKLQMRLAGKLRHLVNSEARVQVASEGLLSGKYVRIVPGSPGAAPLDDGAELATLPSQDLTEGLAQAAVKLHAVLDQADQAVAEFRRGGGPVGEVAQQLKQTTARLDSVVERADDILQSVQRGEGTLGQLVKSDTLYTDLTGTLGQVQGALQDIRSGEGTLGRLVKTSEVHNEAVQSLKDVRKMVDSVKQSSDAIKAMPVVRSYVVDPHKELVRPDCKRLMWWFAETRLFEPGRAVLTDEGRQRLDEVADWIKEQKAPGHEVVVASMAAPTVDSAIARTLTQKQSQVVVDYLRTQKAHRTGFWWWSTRSVRAVGCGNSPPALPDTEGLPPARIEVLVFVPEK